MGGCSALLVQPAEAATRSWIAVNGNWTLASNWSTGIMPQNSDIAAMVFTDNTQRTITYNYPNSDILLNQIQLSGGSSIFAGAAILNLPSGALSATAQQIGINGVGVVNQSGGNNTLGNSSFTTSVLYLGMNASGRGNYNLSGGDLNGGSNSLVYIGYSGAGTFTQTNGSVRLENDLYMANSTFSTGTYIMSGNNSQLRIASNKRLTVGYAGTAAFNQSGGYTLTTFLNIGDGTTAWGTYTLSGGVLDVGNAASFSYAQMVIGNSGHGNFNQSGGTVYVNSPNVASPGLYIGNNSGSAGTYTLSGTGLLESYNRTYVGSEGDGRFIQSGGTNNSAQLYVGSGSGVGEYQLSGSGIVNAGTVLAVQNGTFNQTGGTVNVGTLLSIVQPDQTGQLSITGTYNMNGGTINTHGVELVVRVNGTGGVFNQTAGVHNVTGLLAVGDFGGLVPGTSSVYNLTGGTLTVNPSIFDYPNGGADTSLDGLRLENGGTIVGGASAGTFNGKLSLKGGVIAGTFRNNGLIVASNGTITGSLINRGTLQMNNGVVGAQQTINNEANAKITGSGALNGSVINRGEIAPTGTLSIISVTNTDAGVINIDYGASLVPVYIANYNRINLNGGSIRGAGQVSLEPNPANGGGVLSGGGLVESELILNGGILRADNPTTPMIVNSIDIEDPSSQIIVAPNSVLMLQNPLANGVDVSLQGAGAKLSGSTISNFTAIRGAGEISNQVVNSGLIRAEGGQLTLSNPNNANLSAGQIQAGANTVRFSAGLQINGGVLSMSGGEITNGVASLSNTGTILGRGTLRAGTINNSGTMLFSGGITDIFAPVNNTGRINITGNAVTTFYNPVTTSGGTLNVNLGSTAVFLAPVTGISRVTGAGVKDFESTATLGAITTSLGTTLVGPAGSLTLDYIRDDTLSVVGKMRMNPNGSPAVVSRVNALIIDGAPGNWAGELDLADNDLIIDYADVSPIDTVQSLIRSGFAAGAWNGKGIRSSLATSTRGLGYAESAAAGVSTFDGLGVDSTSVLIKFTYAGDSNLDGQVDIRDLYAMAINYNTAGKVWTSGDYNYDGNVNVQDLTLLANNWQAGVGAPLAQSYLDFALASLGLPVMIVPEPGAVLLLAGFVLFLRRRRDPALN